jgi:HEAT repeat protein
MRYEAARAAGELELISAVPLLVRLAAREDPEIQDVAIWSLGEIGSREALRVLERLAERAYESGNALLIEAIDDAIANASLTGAYADVRSG